MDLTSNPDEIYREKSVFIYGTGGCCGEDGALVLSST